MNAQTPITRPWNYHSAVTACEECNGHGVVRAYRTPTVNDPYPENPCPNCEGEHEPACTVCGSTIEATGYDCIVCQMVADLPTSAMNDASAKVISEAIANAINARRSFDDRKAA